jgi:hypothetical protein
MAMIGRRVYGLVIGAAVGAWPFWLLALLRPARWPGLTGIVIAAVLTATAGRTPAAWLFGVVTGVLSSWVALVVLIGSDWRLLVYVVIGSWLHYLTSVTAMVVAYFSSIGSATASTNTDLIDASRRPSA